MGATGSEVNQLIRVVADRDVKLWTHAFGDQGDPTIIFIAGLTGQAIRWPVELCELFARAGFHVLRFDHRDTGKSSVVDFDKAPYSLDDMAGDVVAIMDAYGIGQAHLIGSSMGGMIAQIAAIQFPERVISLTSMLSTPLTANFNAGMPVDDLPGPDPDYTRRRAEMIPASPNSLEELIEQRVIDYSLISSPPFDPEKQRAFIQSEIERAANYAAGWNHLRAMERTLPSDRRPLLAKLHIPALVVHGRDDPSLRLAHGEATAASIPGAWLLVLDGVGHEFPERAWHTVLRAFVKRVSPFASEARVMPL